MDEPARILIIKPSHMGDVVRAMPVLCAIARHWPAARIDWLIHPANAPLIHAHRCLRRLVPFDRDAFGRWASRPAVARRFFAFLRSLARNRYDLVLDLQGLFRTGFLSWATGARRRLGLDRCRELAGGFYSRRVSTRGAVHAVDVNLCMAAAVGASLEPITFDVPVSEAAWAAVCDRFERLRRPYAVLCPGATAESKRFDTMGFAAVADRLDRRHGVPSVLVGSPAERPIAEEVAARCTSAAPLCLAAETNLAELVAILAHATLCVANDSGPLHVAAALGRPVVGIYGPTDPARVGPYGQLDRVVRSPVPRPPSYRRADRRCIEAVPVEAVLAKLSAVLAERAEGGESDVAKKQHC